jgi:hypothetical protein
VNTRPAISKVSALDKIAVDISEKEFLSEAFDTAAVETAVPCPTIYTRKKGKRNECEEAGETRDLRMKRA